MSEQRPEAREPRRGKRIDNAGWLKSHRMTKAALRQKAVLRQERNKLSQSKK